jgi:hypothetical protein
MDEFKKLPEKIDRGELVSAVRKKMAQQDLEGKEAEYPIDIDSEDYTVLTFTCGSWTVKVREDVLEEARGLGQVKALVQRRLRATEDEYPLGSGVFDEWVERFTMRLESV